jgi:phosphoenolpyruvate---glycerone phosphotransferase subunit DhaL
MPAERGRKPEGGFVVSDSLSPDQVRAGLAAMATALIAHADELNALDAALGDGDLGVTMRIGGKALLDELAALAGADVATTCTRSGLAFNRAAASTIGALIATAGMRAGKEAKGATEIDLALLTRMVVAAETGIRERGKAQRGDKTLLDALIPASEALQQSATEGIGLQEAGKRALAAAKDGREATIPMRGKVGRAHWVGDRTVGNPDAGATALVIALQAVVEPDAGGQPPS